jgi:hypothetical protein
MFELSNTRIDTMKKSLFILSLAALATAPQANAFVSKNFFHKFSAKATAAVGMLGGLWFSRKKSAYAEERVPFSPALESYIETESRKLIANNEDNPYMFGNVGYDEYAVFYPISAHPYRSLRKSGFRATNKHASLNEAKDQALIKATKEFPNDLLGLRLYEEALNTRTPNEKHTLYRLSPTEEMNIPLNERRFHILPENAPAGNVSAAKAYVLKPFCRHTKNPKIESECKKYSLL